MAGITVHIDGLKELNENIKKLSEDMRRKITRAMTRAGAVVVQKAAQQNAPIADEPHEIDGVKIEPGNLRKQIRAVEIKSPRPPLTAEHNVLPRGGEKGKFASRYGSILEYGSVKMAARPWMRPAFDSNIGAAIEAMKKRGEKRLEMAAKGLKHRSGRKKGVRQS